MQIEIQQCTTIIATIPPIILFPSPGFWEQIVITNKNKQSNNTIFIIFYLFLPFLLSGIRDFLYPFNLFSFQQSRACLFIFYLLLIHPQSWDCPISHHSAIYQPLVFQTRLSVELILSLKPPRQIPLIQPHNNFSGPSTAVLLF
jgi:hypothetical protein